MQYRNFGSKIGFRPSALGFGCMRLPHLNDDTGQIDEPEAIKMIRYAIDHGVNYVDTAYGYHRGNSEIVLGKALKDGYREKVKVATKMPMWLLKEESDLDKYFSEQLSKIGVNSIDFYLLHALGKERWKTTLELKVLDWAEKKKADGLIGHLGFSFHDDLDSFKQIVDGYDGWEFCQIQYNYMDITEQAGTEGLKYAAKKGLGVVVMEPIRGGRLGNQPPERVKALWDNASVERTPADWALQWVWDQPEVSVVLSGMSNMKHVLENLDSAERSGVGSLAASERELIDEVRAEYKRLAPVSCTACEYCMPCPKGVEIPNNFEMYNEAIMYNMLEARQKQYAKAPEVKRASNCASCGVCEQKCPQKLPIRKLLGDVHIALSTPQK